MNYFYDDVGNLTDNGTSYKCVYDFRNRLIEVTTRDATPKTIAEYFYDALNRRVEVKTYDTNETLDSDTRYIYNSGWQVIEERDEMNSSALTARASACFRLFGQSPSLHGLSCTNYDCLLCERLAFVLP